MAPGAMGGGATDVGLRAPATGFVLQPPRASLVRGLAGASQTLGKRSCASGTGSSIRDAIPTAAFVAVCGHLAARRRAGARRSAKTARAAGFRCRPLGASGLVVPDVCLGTMTWGNQNTEEEAHAQLDFAVKERGLKFMDTAEMYPIPVSKEKQGRTDRYIGSWMRASGVPREDLILATKVVGWSDRIDWLREAGAPTRVTRAQVKESVEKSLERLGTEYIDLLQIHWPDRMVSLFGSGPYDEKKQRDDDVPFEEQLRAFEELHKEGKVRHFGVSNETSFGVMSFVHAAERAGLPRICSIQNSYSLLVRSAFEQDLAEVCCKRHADVGLLAYSPLAGGSLTGKYLSSEPEGSRLTLFPGYMGRYRNSASEAATKEYVQLAEKHGLTPVQLALGWCRSRWFVTSSIIGATSVEQLKENLDAFEVELSEEVLEGIGAIYNRYRDPTVNPAPKKEKKEEAEPKKDKVAA